MLVLFSVLSGSVMGRTAMIAPSAGLLVNTVPVRVQPPAGLQPTLAPQKPIPAVLPLPTATQEFSPTQTQEPAPASTQEPSPTPVQPVPTEYAISILRGHRQLLSIDCEVAAAVDWANFFGVKIDERLFQNELPVSDNPDYGFVGDVNGAWGELPPHGYGVYAGPVARLLDAYGLPAKAYKGYTLDQLKAKVAQGIPVITWVVGSVDRGSPRFYTDAEGRRVVVAAYEHVVIVIGYTDLRIRYVSEGVTHYAATEAFLQSWGVLGDMVLVDR
jgi:uncharacterized protein YvpB